VSGWLVVIHITHEFILLIVVIVCVPQ